jgi:hypothetical protein
VFRSLYNIVGYLSILLLIQACSPVDICYDHTRTGRGKTTEKEREINMVVITT